MADSTSLNFMSGDLSRGNTGNYVKREQKTGLEKQRHEFDKLMVEGIDNSFDVVSYNHTIKRQDDIVNISDVVEDLNLPANLNKQKLLNFAHSSITDLNLPINMKSMPYGKASEIKLVSNSPQYSAQLYIGKLNKLPEPQGDISINMSSPRLFHHPDRDNNFRVLLRLQEGIYSLYVTDVGSSLDMVAIKELLRYAYSELNINVNKIYYNKELVVNNSCDRDTELHEYNLEHKNRINYAV